MRWRSCTGYPSEHPINKWKRNWNWSKVNAFRWRWRKATWPSSYKNNGKAIFHIKDQEQSNRILNWDKIERLDNNRKKSFSKHANQNKKKRHKHKSITTNKITHKRRKSKNKKIDQNKNQKNNKLLSKHSKRSDNRSSTN